MGGILAPLVIMTGHLTAQAYFPRVLIESLVSGDIPQCQWLRQVMLNGVTGILSI